MKLIMHGIATRLAAGVLLTNLFVLSLAGIALYQSRQQYEHFASVTTKNLAHSVAINVAGVFDKIDVGLLAANREIDRQINAGAINDKSLTAYLSEQKAQLRDLEGMWVSDEEGHIHWGTDLSPGKLVTIGDREYFQRLRSDPTLGLVISKPVIGRITNAWSVLVARRINHSDGSFAGVVMGSLRILDYFDTMFAKLDVGKQGAISLRDEQMALIVRHPNSSGKTRELGSTAVAAEVWEMLRADQRSGTVHVISGSDGIERIYGYERVGEYPLYVFVGQATQDYLTPWRSERKVALALVLSFALVSVLATWLSYKHLRERSVAKELLHRKNELEMLVNERTQELAVAKTAAEKGLQNEQIVMAAIVESSDDAIFGMATDGTVTTWNQGAQKTFGYSADEMVGQSVFKLVPPERQREVESVLATIHRGEAVAIFETERLRKGGERIEVSIAASPIRDHQWRIVGASTIARNIAERKRADKALAESEYRWKFAIEGAGDGVSDWDVTNNKVFFSKRWKEMLGFSEDEINNDPQEWQSRVHHDDLPQALSNIQSHTAGNTKNCISEYRMRCKDGSWKWILDRSCVVSRDEQGRPLRVVGIHSDITERRSTEAKFRAIVEQSMIGVYVLDGPVVQYVNPRCAQIFGYSPAEWEGMSFLPLVAIKDQSRVINEIERLMSGQTSIVHIEYTARHKSGSEIVVGSEASLTEIAGKAVVIGVIQDVTEKVQSQEQVRQYVAQLETAFMSTVSVATTLCEMRDPYTGGHQRRVAEIAVAIGGEMGLSEHQCEGLRVAGYLHDIGKITVPSEILSKPGKLNPIEFMLIKGHAQAGYEVLKDVQFPWPVSQVALQHHERMDGSGYPQGLKGDAILLEARIVAVADVVEAMYSHRPYRAGLGIDLALAEIERGSGRSYDADVVQACLRLFRENGYTVPT